MPLLQFSELVVGLIDCVTVSGSSFEPEDAADAPLLLTVERGEAVRVPVVAIPRRWPQFEKWCFTQSGWR